MRWCRLLSRLVSQQGVNREVGTFRDIRRRCSERSDLGLQARPRDCLLAWQRRGFVLSRSDADSRLLLVHALVRWRFAFFLLLAGSHRCTQLASIEEPLPSMVPRGRLSSTERKQVLDTSSSYIGIILLCFCLRITPLLSASANGPTRRTHHGHTEVRREAPSQRSTQTTS